MPLSEVEDRVLFAVESQLSGPWRVGSLDVYDGKDWRLPPFAENRLSDVPRDGVVDKDLSPGVRATFTIAGLGGAVLPGLPNTVGVVAEGPRLAYDNRSGTCGWPRARSQAGLAYTVAAAALPNVEDLRDITEPNSRAASTGSPRSRRRRRRWPTCSTRRRSAPSGTRSTSSAPTSSTT